MRGIQNASESGELAGKEDGALHESARQFDDRDGPRIGDEDSTQTIAGSNWDFDTGRSNFNSGINDDNTCVTSVN